jgi:hypothetical protein
VGEVGEREEREEGGGRGGERERERERETIKRDKWGSYNIHTKEDIE